MSNKIILLLILVCGIPSSLSGATGARILTLNVLADPVSEAKRVKAIYEIVKEENPDIVCFQETAPWFVSELKKTDFFEKYQVLKKGEIYVVPAGLMVAVRKDFGKLGDVAFAPLPSRQGRYFMIQQIKIEGVGLVAVATSHLESFLEDSEVRRKQMNLIFKNLAEYDRVIFAADFNFGDDGKTELAAIPKGYVDSWKTVNAGDSGFTWNIEKSLMAKNGSFPNEKSRRLDHIYIKGGHQVVDAKIVGDVEIEAGLFPSDHFGVLVNIRMVKK
jgi:endonuclease/exonuclease/phosphatase family metal-dependent hydrolase